MAIFPFFYVHRYLLKNNKLQKMKLLFFYFLCMDHVWRVKRMFHKNYMLFCLIVQGKWSKNYLTVDSKIHFHFKIVQLLCYRSCNDHHALSCAYLSCADITYFTSASVAVGNLLNAASEKEDKPSAEQKYI